MSSLATLEELFQGEHAYVSTTIEGEYGYSMSFSDVIIGSVISIGIDNFYL